MNKLCYFICICVLFSSCAKTPQQLAENAVKTFLKEHLKNPGDYKPVAFDTLKVETVKDSLQTELDYLKSGLSYSPDTAKNKAAIALIEKRMQKPGIDTLVAERLIKHTYKHKGLDDQPVQLEVTFWLDKDYRVIDYNAGIQGQAYFDVFVVAPPASFYRIDKYAIDGQEFSLSDVKHSLAYGKHTITYWVSDKSLLDDSYLYPVPLEENLYLQDGKKDSVPQVRIVELTKFVMLTYDSMEDFKKTEDAKKVKL